MIKPYGDVLLVELTKSEFATAETDGEQDDPRMGSGKVVAIPEAKDILFFGSFNWAFDASMLDVDTAEQLVTVMERLQGKTVYFEKRSDIGTTVDDGDKRYALIKLAKIMGVAA